MTPSAAKIHAVIAILAGCVAACTPTKPPTDQLGIASRNVANARGAGAQQYAPQDLRAAESHLAGANAAMAKQDYDQAAMLAGEAAVDAELAAARARREKAREAADTLRAQNQELERDAARHPDGADAQ
jgi:hypothetical protein